MINIQNIGFISQWSIIMFLIGLIFLPITSLIFKNFFDKGYIFSKILGLTILSYSVFVLGLAHILSFSRLNIFILLVSFLTISFLLFKKGFLKLLKNNWKIFVLEELLFLITLSFWSFIKAHQPDINGLEKFMDFGFINSILRADYFPPKDMWLTPFPINYYYFGHLMTAVVIKLSGIQSAIGYNLMLSSIFAFTFTGAFSIGLNLFNSIISVNRRLRSALISGLLTAFLVTLAGNLHPIYSFFTAYQNENPKPLWDLVFNPSSFPNSYWYPNATRFIYNTIHEFPSYSFVVSDLHGHVLDIPIVLLTIALLLSIFLSSLKDQSQVQSAKFKAQSYSSKFKILKNIPQLLPFNFKLLTLLAFLLAIMYMTNVLDFPIYLLLAVIVISYLFFKQKLSFLSIISQLSSLIFLLLLFFFFFAFPFNLNFKPFVSGIGILCAPDFLVKIEKIGPFLLEADHCQKSPIWQLITLYGFFYFWVISFLIYLRMRSNKNNLPASRQVRINPNNSHKFALLKFADISMTDIFILILIAFSTLLIIFPEFFYFKDIYPAHYRANTMFKFVYQAFILLSICSAYIITRTVFSIKNNMLSMKINEKILNTFYLIFATFLLFIVLLYPYFAINSYFGELKTYYGLNGINYLKNRYPSDLQAIKWINENIKKQPVIVEAQGDSYTDYARISSNTGLPTILGWTVHEWLWRGSYDIPSPRIDEVANIYESENLEEIKSILKKYNVSYVYIGELEQEKYQNLNEEKFYQLGKEVYKNEGVIIFEISSK